MIGHIAERIFSGRLTSSARKPGFVAHIIRLDQNFRQRQKFASLSDDALKDIGLTRKQVETELRNPIWDPPIQMR